MQIAEYFLLIIVIFIKYIQRVIRKVIEQCRKNWYNDKNRKELLLITADVCKAGEGNWAAVKCKAGSGNGFAVKCGQNMPVYTAQHLCGKKTRRYCYGMDEKKNRMEGNIVPGGEFSSACSNAVQWIPTGADAGSGKHVQGF